MSQKRPQSASPEKDNCRLIPTIIQSCGTCWFNAIITCLLYGNKFKELFNIIFTKKDLIIETLLKKKLKTSYTIVENPEYIKAFDIINKNEILEVSLEITDKYNKYMKNSNIIYYHRDKLENIFSIFEIIYSKTLVHSKLKISKVSSYVTTDDIIVDLMTYMYEYNNNFNMLAKNDIGGNIIDKINYIINISHLFNININIFNKTLRTYEYDYIDHDIDKLYLCVYNYFITPNKNTDALIVIDTIQDNNFNIKNNENFKYNKKFYKLDSFIISSIRNKYEPIGHAISCVKCNKDYYISDTANSNKLIPIDITTKIDWFIRDNSIVYITAITDISDDTKDVLLFNFGKGDKIYFYLEEKIEPIESFSYFTKVGTSKDFVILNNTLDPSSPVEIVTKKLQPVPKRDSVSKIYTAQSLKPISPVKKATRSNPPVRLWSLR